MDLNLRIGQRVLGLRAAQGLSLDALAARSGVSRSNISLIERGRSSPTAVVLAKLAQSLDVSLASLFEPAEVPAAPSLLSHREDQPVWTDPASGYVRRTLSPPAASPLQLAEVTFPAGKRVAYEAGERDRELHQQVWMLEGTMELGVGETRYRLTAGDCLVMRLDQPTSFRNPTRRPARYLVALTALPRRPAGRSR
jgi:transcriptional regulator with XRE-family HTH domain